MQIYSLVSRYSRRKAASPIWYENFEQKRAAYTPVFTVLAKQPGLMCATSVFQPENFTWGQK